MNGFKLFVILAVVCLIIGAFAGWVPGCKPPDVSNCTLDVDNHRYICPEENK
jgi:hypothetical protein